MALVGDGFWTVSQCRPEVQWYGIPGQGCWYYTARYGQHWVGGGVWQRYSQAAFECGTLGEPVKDYQWLSEFGNWGQWFLGGAIYYKNGSWLIALGDYGQTAGRLTDEIDLQPVPSDAPERRPDHVPGPPK